MGERVEASKAFRDHVYVQDAVGRYPHAVGVCVEAVQLIYKAAGGAVVYQKGPLDRCLRDILTMTQHVVGTTRTYEMAGRLPLGFEPLRFLFS